MSPLSTRRQIEGTLLTVAEMLRHREEIDALHVLNLAEIDLDYIYNDNWNGGTEVWKAHLRIPIKMYVSIEKSVKKLVEVIDNDVSTVLGEDTGIWLNVEIGPQKVPPKNFKSPDGIISTRTKSAVLDELRARKTVWYGDVNEVEFLNEIFDLTSMPSSDSRFEDAEGDIWQHCINNDDWPLDWIFDDERFSLYTLNQDKFLKFISKVLNPTVRKDAIEQAQLAEAFNGHLKHELRWFPTSWLIALAVSAGLLMSNSGRRTGSRLIR